MKKLSNTEAELKKAYITCILIHCKHISFALLFLFQIITKKILLKKNVGKKKKKLYPDKCIFRYFYLLTFRCVFNVDFQQMLPGYFTL